VLLVVGLLGLVFVATIAYVIAGPDGLEDRDRVNLDGQRAGGPIGAGSLKG
jgi:hypothetical protein